MVSFELRSTGHINLPLVGLYNPATLIKSLFSDFKHFVSPPTHPITTPYLPPEILGNIFAEVISNLPYCKRVRFLKSASLVSQDWWYESQRLLHQSVMLDSDERAARWLISRENFSTRRLECRGMNIIRGNGGISLPVLRELLETVGEGLHHLEIVGLQELLPVAFLSIPALRNLPSFDLQTRIASTSTLDIVPLNLAAILPSLTTLSLSSLPGPSQPLISLFEDIAPQLHHLTFSGSLPLDVLPYLSKCSSLESLIYTNAPIHLNHLLSTLPPHLPTLTIRMPYAFDSVDIHKTCGLLREELGSGHYLAKTLRVFSGQISETSSEMEEIECEKELGEICETMGISLLTCVG